MSNDNVTDKDKDKDKDTTQRQARRTVSMQKSWRVFCVLKRIKSAAKKMENIWKYEELPNLMLWNFYIKPLGLYHLLREVYTTQSTVNVFLSHTR